MTSRVIRSTVINKARLHVVIVTLCHYCVVVLQYLKYILHFLKLQNGRRWNLTYSSTRSRKPLCRVMYTSEALPPHALERNPVLPRAVMTTNTLTVLFVLCSDYIAACSCRVLVVRCISWCSPVFLWHCCTWSARKRLAGLPLCRMKMASLWRPLEHMLTLSPTFQTLTKLYHRLPEICLPSLSPAVLVAVSSRSSTAYLFDAIYVGDRPFSMEIFWSQLLLCTSWLHPAWSIISWHVHFCSGLKMEIAWKVGHRYKNHIQMNWTVQSMLRHFYCNKPSHVVPLHKANRPHYEITDVILNDR